MPHDLSPEMRAALDDPEVRGSVTDAVRRRVPSDAVHDVAQAVYCEALESKTGPATSDQIPYWLVGVARHTAADFFRKRPRELLSREPSGWDENESIDNPPRYDVREAISRVLASLGEGAKKTLFWMVLEHEGVELQAIAKEEQMSPAAVRARVYRLRRTLRKELAYLLCGVLLLGGAVEAFRAHSSKPARPVAHVVPAPAFHGFPVPVPSVGASVGSPVAPRVEPLPPVPSAGPSASAAPSAPPAPSASSAPVPSVQRPPVTRSSVTQERPSRPPAPTRLAPTARPPGSESSF
jgi:DNA-directed RNA polymerase specialized sigma24 family protein